MTISVKDNRIPTKRFIDIFNGDAFVINGTVYIKINGFRINTESAENFYNSIDINRNFHYFISTDLINPIKKITLTIEE